MYAAETAFLPCLSEYRLITEAMSIITNYVLTEENVCKSAELKHVSRAWSLLIRFKSSFESYVRYIKIHNRLNIC
jgi:hypothetical protein